jgi:hypothetical protein
MSTDQRSAIAEFRRFAAGRPAPALPPQKNWSGWLRAALAFQPARPAVGATPSGSSRTTRSLQTPSASGDAPKEARTARSGSAERPNFDELQAAFSALPPADRLMLRRHPSVLASMLGSSVAQAVDHSCSTARDVASALAGKPKLRAGRVKEDDLLRAFDAVSRLAAQLDRLMADARARADDPDPYPADVLSLARDVDEAVGRLPTLGRARIQGRVDARGHAQDRAVELSATLLRVHDRARELSSILDQRVGSLRGMTHTRGIGQLLAFVGWLDDFTEADLSRVDLAGVDLEGVRWSERGTRWPPGEQERIRRESRETAPGSGVWVVTRGTATADSALV